MAGPAPPRQQISIIKSNQPGRSGGILPVTAANTKGRAPNGPTPPARVSVSPRLKTIIRRLPPALTETEFAAAVGHEWRVGGGKVDWFSYRIGKVSKDPAKPSKPSRAYLHLTREDHLLPLSEKIRETSFVDGKGSNNDSSLLGPPSVEFAPYGRVPASRPRTDGRQGTIDQDPEFIDFLESLTNPVTKPPTVDAGSDKENAGEKEKVVTPLIQYLRDKKANKGKEPTVTTKDSKHSRQEPKDNKAAPTEPKTIVKKGKESSSTPDKRSAAAVKVEKLARDATRVLNKQAAAIMDKPAPLTSGAVKPGSQAPAQPPTTPAAKPERRRERGSASAAAKILQRDLGLGGPAGRRKREATPTNSATTTPSVPTSNVNKSVATGDTANATSASVSANISEASKADSAKNDAKVATGNAVPPPTAPAAARNQRKPNPAPPGPSGRVQQQTAAASTPKAAVAPTSTQAFLKHANPSQGVTEPLLEAAFSNFGIVTKVEIDKKKGFAYLDFSSPEGLQSAIAASPVKVAQGQVVVLERKTGTSLQNRNAKGGAAPAVAARGGAAAATAPAPTAPRGGRNNGGRGRGGRGGAGNGGKVENTPAAPATKPPAIIAAASSQASAATATGAVDASSTTTAPT